MHAESSSPNSLGTSLRQAISQQKQLEEAIKQLPEVERVLPRSAPLSVADNFIILKDRKEWPDPGKSKNQVVADLEAAVTPIPGNRYEFLQPIHRPRNASPSWCP